MDGGESGGQITTELLSHWGAETKNNLEATIQGCRQPVAQVNHTFLLRLSSLFSCTTSELVKGVERE